MIACPCLICFLLLPFLVFILQSVLHQGCSRSLFLLLLTLFLILIFACLFASFVSVGISCRSCSLFCSTAISLINMNALPPRVLLPCPIAANLYASRCSPTLFKSLFLAVSPYVPTCTLQFRNVLTPGTALQFLRSGGALTW